ncbi:MAG: L,D-transpeptidase family protein [Flavipsychrobacter sp.]|nr:L,D-transpeptidase family protein [Flavipsychrobacter sp.]
MTGRIRILLCIVLFQLGGLAGQAAPVPASSKEKLNFPTLTNKFCQKKKSFWSAPTKRSASLRREMLELVEKCNYKGLAKKRYHPEMLRELNKEELSIAEARSAEVYFTDAAISYCKDMIKSPKIDGWLSYDELSKKFRNKDDEQILTGLLEVTNAESLKSFASSLEPNDKEYKVLLMGLADQIEEENTPNVKKIKATLAYYRWMYHFKFDEFIVVNIAAARLRYYKDDNIALTMKVVAGRNPTETPRFTAYCDRITTYPFWHVPRSIATKEILPFCKENEADIANLNMSVMDKNGKIVDPTKLKWQKFTVGNFPYNFRQDPGCDNPLGIIKFNLTNPFDIYMHDTNVKPSFKARKRFFSHGCIRLEKPVELANLFLTEPLPYNFMDECLENQRPKAKNIRPIPVFVIYMPAEVTAKGTISVYEDVYEIL